MSFFNAVQSKNRKSRPEFPIVLIALLGCVCGLIHSKVLCHKGFPFCHYYTLMAHGDYTLQEGAFGRYVYNLQVGLEAAGYLTDSADGMLSVKTKKAVIDFQSYNGLDADGLAGKKTKKLLFTQQKTAIEADGV